MAKNQEKTPYQGRQSGKSSTRWFGGGDPNTEAGRHGTGARAGDGNTTNSEIAGKIRVIFRPGK